MANKLYEESDIKAIADAIRVKNGSSSTYQLWQMADEILAIETQDETVPTHFYTEAFKVVQKIADFKKTHPNNLVFGTISDNHVYANNATYEKLSKSSVRYGAFALETVGAMVECDFVANLGDNCWENGSETDNAYQGSLYVVSITQPFHERLTSFSLVGNHDKNVDPNVFYELIGQYNDFDVRSDTHVRSFGYKDFADKKVRVICLNTCDYLLISGGCALSYEQKDFLMRALDLSAKTDCAEWQILLLSHIPLDWNGGDYNFHADIKAILDAYVDGTTASITVNSSYAKNETPSSYATYSGGKLVYNYSGKNLAKIIANIHGHVHTDVYGKIADNDILRMATPNTCFYLGKAESYPDYGDYSIDAVISRTANTPTETSATFYCIDLDKQVVYSYAYGAGNDRVVPYKEATTYTVTYNLTDVTCNNTATSAVEGTSYTAILSVGSDYAIDSVTVTMGGVDVTSSVYSNGVITIAEVTGNIVITAKAKDNYVPYWDIANRTAVTDMYKTPTDTKALSRKNYYYGAARTGAVYYSYIQECSVSGNDVTFTCSTKNVGIGLPYHLDADASYTFSAKANATGRVGMVVLDASGKVVSGTEKYSSSGTSPSVTFTAPTDATYWVMLIVECYTANASITYTDITLTKN